MNGTLIGIFGIIIALVILIGLIVFIFKTSKF